MIKFFSNAPKCSSKHIFQALFVITLCLVLHIWIMQDILKFVDDITSIVTKIKLKNVRLTKSNDTKYILSWNSYHLMKNKEESVFSELNCPVNNCLFTGDRNLLKSDYTYFDAIIFDEGDLMCNKDRPRPTKRTSSQIYIFNTIKSSYNQPACELCNDNFFNWTFTYRLDSEVVWNYFVIRNRTGAIVAPSMTPVWNTSSEPVRQEIRSILAGKHKAVAWLVSHCKADSLRDDYLTRLQEHLFQYSLKIDVYGSCTGNRCTNDNCEDMLKKSYLFYMAFENSIADDYVTEKVLHGYNNLAVLVVYGGANYSRFLPPGSYINARNIHPYNLAHTINQAVKHRDIFENYFKWTNLYTVDSNWKAYHPLCDLCAALNDENMKSPAMPNFRIWWNGKNGMKWCLSKDYWNETASINLD